MTNSASPASPAPGRLPRKIPYIIGNEGCERFGFCGMRNILAPLLIGSTLLAHLPPEMRDGAATDVFHIFVIGAYTFPLPGGWLIFALYARRYPMQDHYRAAS